MGGIADFSDPKYMRGSNIQNKYSFPILANFHFRLTKDNGLNPESLYMFAAQMWLLPLLCSLIKFFKAESTVTEYP